MFRQLFTPANYYLNYYAIPVFLVSLLVLLIGSFVLKQNKRSVINIAFFLFCLSIGLWLFTISFVYSSINPSVAIFWYRHFTFLGVINILPSLIFMGICWLGKSREKKNIIIFNYVIAHLFYILAVTTDKILVTGSLRKYFWGFYPIYSPWAAIFIFIFLFQFVIGFGNLYSAYKKENVFIRKAQLRVTIIATLVAFTASLDFLPKFFNIPLYPYGYISMLVYISMVAYSIVRYKAFDIETAIHKTIMWLLSFSLIVIPVVVLYRTVFIKQSNIAQTVFWVISLLSVAFYLRIVQPRIDHFFQRRSANLEDISSRFTEEVVHLKEIGRLIQRIKDIIAGTLYPQRVDVFIYNEDQMNYLPAKEAFRLKEVTAFKSAEEFLRWLAKNNKIVYREFIDIDPVFTPIKEKAKDYFNLTGAMVVIPLALNENLLGMINLTKKSNLKRYTGAEINFLNTLKNQSTIAISNSLLYKNMEERVQERTKELVTMQKQLIHAEKLATIGTLAGGVAHEINNPLTAILTNAQMLLVSNGQIGSDDKESLKLIEEATKRCRSIVQKLMTYAKKPLETTKVSTVNLLDVVKSTTSFLDYQLKQENIRLVVEAKDSDYLVAGSHNELEQVITNMILNAKDAIKQVKAGGDIRILFSKSNEWVKLTVKDDGIGIPKEVIAKIFDPFFTTKDVGKGTGLGLSICQGIIEKHSGTITVQSEPYKGSAFTIQLPRARRESRVENEVKL